MSDDTDEPAADVTLEGEEFHIRAEEKVSTGDYESATFHQSISGSVKGAEELDNEGLRAVMAELHRVQNALASNVRYMGKKRVEEVQEPDDREHSID